MLNILFCNRFFFAKKLEKEQCRGEYLSEHLALTLSPHSPALLFPFSPYPLLLSTPATQAINFAPTLDNLKTFQWTRNSWIL